MGKRFLASVANVELFEKNDGKLIHFASAKTLTDSAFGFTLSMEEVRAGQGGKLYGRFAHTSGMTFTMTDAMFDINYIRALIGAEEGEGEKAVLHKQTVTAAASVDLDAIPVNLSSLCGMKEKIAWAHVADCNGEGEEVVVEISDDNKVNLSQFVKTNETTTVCLSYFVNDPSATLMKIKAKFIPAELVAIATVQEFAGDASTPESGKPAGELIIKIPRFQLDGQFDLTLNMTSAASIALNGTALAVSGGNCDGDDYYAEIVERVEGAKWYNGLKQIVVDEEYLKVGQIPMVYGLYKNGSMSLLNNKDLVFDPELNTKGAWSAAGEQTVTANDGTSTKIDSDSVTIVAQA